MTNDLKRLIRSKLVEYPNKLDWERAIKNYVLDVINRKPEGTYYQHRFSFYDFVNQKNGILKFINK
jgi:hypothetical protein